MQSILSASLFVSASGIMSLIAGFASSVIVARMLGAEGTGLTALALWVAITGSIIATRGIPAVVLRYIRRQGEKVEARNGFTIYFYKRFIWPVVLVSALFLPYALYTYQSAGTNTALVWVVAGLTSLAYGQGHFVMAADHGLGHYFGAAKKTVAGCILQVPVTIAGAFFFGPAGAMAGYLARHVPQAFGLSTYLTNGRPDKAEISDQMIRYGQSNWISIILDTLIKTRVEFLFLTFFFTVLQVGYFAAAVTFSSLILQLAMYLAAGLTPGFGRLYDDKATQQLKLSYDRSMRWLSMLLVPVSFGGAVIMPLLIPMAFGNDFMPAVPIAVLLVFFSLPQALYSVPLAAMLAFENDRRLVYMNGTAAAALVGLNLIFTPYYGGVGAAVIRGVIGVSIFLWLVVHCHNRLGLSINLSSQIRILISGIACAATAYAIVATVGGLGGLLLSIPAAAIVYAVFLRLTKSVPESDLQVIETTVEKFAPARFKPFLKPAISLLGTRT